MNFMANLILDLGKYREPSSTSRQTVLHNTKLAALKVRPQTSSQQQYVGTCQPCKFSAQPKTFRNYGEGAQEAFQGVLIGNHHTTAISLPQEAVF